MSMDYAEKLAKIIIELVLPRAKMQYHINQSAGSHDFDLKYSDGTYAAVEVTISTNQIREATVAEITHPRKGGAFIKATLCRKDWFIHPLPTASINRIRALADVYLAAIEADGLDKFIGPIDSDSYLSVALPIKSHLPTK